jgi:Na+-transporting NADH:ubiquinone oxidoreductase subunit F
MFEIIIGVITFSAIVLSLTGLVLGARRILVPSGHCGIRVNEKTTLQASIGQRLMEVLTSADIHLPSACGGAGTCGLCKARVVEGGGEAKPQEIGLLSRKEIANGVRLSCQVPVLGPMRVEVDDIYFGVETWQCRVVSVRYLATLIKEIILELPGQTSCQFRAGSFVQISCPAFNLDFADFQVDQDYRDIWDRDGIRSLRIGSDQQVSRAYSVANPPGEERHINLNIRLALPPAGNNQIPPGIVSSWLFSLKPGDTVEASGPFGHFFVEPNDREAIFIGGGVGMAPLYAQILDLLQAQKSQRKISYWYGARCKRELYYDDVFERLQSRYDNFSWHVALSEPEANDDWKGNTGFIHKVIVDKYLAEHPAPEDCDYYLCGPPLMITAVLTTLDNLGVDARSIHFDDFGGG